jgi:hypothetical protein
MRRQKIYFVHMGLFAYIQVVPLAQYEAIIQDTGECRMKITVWLSSLLLIEKVAEKHRDMLLVFFLRIFGHSISYKAIRFDDIST